MTVSDSTLTAVAVILLKTAVIAVTRRVAVRPDRGYLTPGELPDLIVTAVEVLQDERELEDARVSEKGLVVAKKRRTHRG